MTVLAFLTEPDPVRTILGHLGLPTTAPRPRPFPSNRERPRRGERFGYRLRRPRPFGPQQLTAPRCGGLVPAPHSKNRFVRAHDGRISRARQVPATP